MKSPTGRLANTQPALQNIPLRTEDGRKIREAFTREYDYGHEVPPSRPEPEPPLRSKCVGGPWHGAYITHDASDTGPRMVEAGELYGQYEYSHLDLLWHWFVGDGS